MRTVMMPGAVRICLLFLLSLSLFATAAQEQTSEASAADLVERGAYLARISGCLSCHSPYRSEYADPARLTPDNLQTLVFSPMATLDLENGAFSGGRPIDLGPMGVVWTANITQDVETGIGAWTDQQIEIAIRIGLNPSGRRLYPVMPYRTYFSMADADMQALIAYLRTLAPIRNAVDRSGPSGAGIAPDLRLDGLRLTAPPDGSDPVALGEYLVESVMNCTDCHTPLDPGTGVAMMDLWLAGGQAYEGPWGIVYGKNITPHVSTGIGTSTAEQVADSLRRGLDETGRRLILMPWEDYTILSDQDVTAIITYLQSIPAIVNHVPEPSIDEAFLQYAEN